MKKDEMVAGAVILIGGAFLYLHYKSTSSTTTTQTTNPFANIFAGNATATPTSQPTIDMTQAQNFLSNGYFPLFGFVGVSS